MSTIKILFVCMGNICRSPTAEGAFTKLVKEKRLAHRFTIDSAGTHAYHTNEAPDLRAQKAAIERGIDLSQLRARPVVMGDFEEFDLLLAMDDDNYQILTQKCPPHYRHKLKYLMDFAPHIKQREVPDPYYGGSYGFEQVLDMVEAAAEGLLTHVQNTTTQD
jgi:protein-tyrosine phosphatase